MTGRKPPGVSWQTWIDRQIEEARDRGEFDDLPGAGQPIDGIDRPRDELWWVREKLRREGVEYLPPSIAIRKQASQARARALDAPTEQDARRIIDEINAEIRHLNSHIVTGPPTTVVLFDVDEVLAEWRDRRTTRELAVPAEPPRFEAAPAGSGVVARLRGRWKATRATARANWRAWRIAARNRAEASTCFYCGVRFTEDGPDHRTVDHRIPKSRGGSNGLRNLVFACYACNQRKRDRLEDDFVTSDWLTARRAAKASEG